MMNESVTCIKLYQCQIAVDGNYASLLDFLPIFLRQIWSLASEFDVTKRLFVLFTRFDQVLRF